MRGLRRTLRARPSEVELQEHSSESPRQKAMASHGNANTHRKTFCALYILVALLGVIAILAGVLAVVSVLRLLALETRINNLATLVQVSFALNFVIGLPVGYRGSFRHNRLDY